ncbi:MAG: alkaline phosphatase family protein [Candidatus Aenigmatarchaeota archaeon]
MLKKEFGRKVFVLAIPHFDWKLVELMMKKGYFKNLKKLMKTGTRGSIWIKGEEVNTPVEFTSMITGVDRSKHGIGYGEQTDKEYVKDGRMINRLDIKVPTVWEIAERNGKKVGIYNWVVTWPPTKVNGFMITGRLSQDDNITYPKELKKELLQLNSRFDRDELRITDHCHNFFHPKTAIYLIEKYKPDLFLGMYEAAHGRDHMWWAFIEPKEAKAKLGIDIDRNQIEKYRKKLFDLFKILDIFFGEVRKKWAEAILIVLGESGMRVRDEIIYSTGGGFTEMFDELKLGIKLYAYDLYPPHLPKAKPRLYVPGKTSYEKKRIINSLQKIKIKKNGENFFKEVRWDGDWLSFSFNFHPAWLEDVDDPYIEVILPDKRVHKIRITIQTGCGTHSKGAVFIANGPGIKENYILKKKIYSVDIAPTILHLLGCNIPKGMDGRIITEMLK